MKTDLEKELKDALKNRDSLLQAFHQNEGVISFLNYIIEKEKEVEEVKG